ncbi:DNA-binding response regulator [Flavobacterium collinsii]|uniref:LytR/AlgR family response regulator transcription factor n=1 Tax=Flavobacterium collinsii TaxID=1114861 RepID=UPI0022BCF1BB|nr:LytTR family DNA-binding domain-containing protein [Flavobacterium collinsii]GIQ61203.1 DNA-binding response regulator [Flavobacterium collinsii]
MISKINAILVDDDFQNLELLKYFLTKFCPLINIIGEASNVEDSIKLINKLSPQVVYLDIQLHEKNAFEILDRIDFSEIEIIFVTAYNDYALKAFKYNAIDYIIKPIIIDDIVLATNKVIMKLNEKEQFNHFLKQEPEPIHEVITLPSKSESLIHPSTSDVASNEHLTINSLDKMVIMRKEDILFCKSDGRYTTFFLDNNIEHVSSKNIGEYNAMLDKTIFFRIHHSYIVNVNHIAKINKKQGYYCEMSNGAKLPIARRRLDNLKSILQI